MSRLFSDTENCRSMSIRRLWFELRALQKSGEEPPYERADSSRNRFQAEHMAIVAPARR